MGRWTIASDGQVMVVESSITGLVSVDIPSGTPFVAGVDGIRDVRTKLGLAIGDAQSQSGESR